MEFLNAIKELIPDYAKVIRLKLDGTIARSSLQGNDAVGVALAAAFAARSKRIVDIIKSSNAITPEEMHAALSGAAGGGGGAGGGPGGGGAGGAGRGARPAQGRRN